MKRVIVVTLLQLGLISSTVQAELLSLFPFDETSGNPANAVANVPGGTLKSNRSDSALPQYVPGVMGNALKFAGDGLTTGNWVDASKTGFPRTGDSNGCTVGSSSFWIKAEASSPATCAVMGVSNSGGSQKSTFSIITLENGDWRLYIRANNKKNFMFAGALGDWRDGKWHHLVLAWDVDKDAKIYLDGADKSAAFSLTDDMDDSDQILAWDNPMHIGAAGRKDDAKTETGIQNTLDGCLDDVGVWNERLTGAQAAALCNLANEQALKYGTKDADGLFGIFAKGAQGQGKTSDGKSWKYASGLTGAPGAVVGGNAVILDDKGNGVQLVP